MDGSNSNQNNQNKQNSQNSNQPKSGLSWTQPTNSTQTKNTPPGSSSSKVVSAAAQTTDSTGRVIGIIVGIIVVFALAAWGIIALNKRSASNGVSTATSTSETIIDTSSKTSISDTAPATTPVGAPATVAREGSATLSVASVQDAGGIVAFSDLSVSQPTWIIVYESTDGQPGRILGAELYFKGNTSGVVHLLRPTVSGKTYYVSAAIDNGDKTFAKADEKYVPDASGKQMWIKFETK